ncbi:hypothetical protein HZA33_04440, partial [Candidatus Pacearchaeota archaeon]|nr:hypothetical protein [Candidatus Pacearchaeota archaeon]
YARAYLSDDFDTKVKSNATLENKSDAKTPAQNQGTLKTEDQDWKVSLGISRSFPKLTAVNAEIKGIEAELRQLAPEVKPFETWKDVYTGLLGLRAEKKISDNVKRNLWLGMTVAYGKGDVATHDSPMTVYGCPIKIDFKQQFKTLFLYPSIAYESKKKIAGFTPTFFAGPDFAFLNADTNLYYHVLAAPGARTVQTLYKDKAVGAFVGLALERKGKINAKLEFQYNWTKLRGNGTVIDSISGNIPATRPVEADFSGPSYLLWLSKEF